MERRSATKTYLGQGTTQEIGKEVPKRSRDTEVKETNKQSGFDPAGVKSLLNVDERDKSVLVTAEAQGVHEVEGHGVGTPAETALGRVELWKNVGGNASVNEVLKKFESARRERNGAVGVKRSGVTISLDDRDDKAGLPSGRNHREPQHKVEEGKQKMTPPRERDFEERVWQAVRARCRLVALGECSNEFVVREGRIKSARFVQGRERREAERN